MDSNEIQTRVDALCAILNAKGKAAPMVQAQIESHTQPRIYYRWDKVSGRYGDWDSHVVSADSIEESLDKAEAEIMALPTAEQSKFNEFMAVLGQAIDVGRKNGIDVKFLNPLEKLSQDLSKNALEFTA